MLISISSVTHFKMQHHSPSVIHDLLVEKQHSKSKSLVRNKSDE